MKHLMVNCKRWHLLRRSRLIGVASALLMFVFSAQGQIAILPPIGGPGGAPFDARCAPGLMLTGFELRVGNDIDAIRPICVAAYGPTEAGPLEPYPFKYGGAGGGADLQLLCPRETPIVIAMYVRAEGVRTISVNNIHLFCGVAGATQRLSDYPSAVHDGPYDQGVKDSPRARQKAGTLYCPAGLVANGIKGRSGIYLDALGLICGAPRITPRPVQAPVDVRVIKPQPRVTAPADMDALAARGAVIANEDPFVAELRNQQPDGRARRGFDIGMAASEGQTAPGPGKQKIHDYLGPIEREGFSTAVSFSLARNRRRLAELADRGAAIANQDPLAADLRKQQPNDEARRGFDVGMAASEGHTAPGPGKDRIRDSLPQAEQGGFTTAVTFSIARNRQRIVDLADKGRLIAQQDLILEEVRNSNSDVQYREGFDIASGIFGDPALGAKGDTVRGPASLAIRDTLTLAGQRGFNASTTLHLSRNYKQTSASITVAGAVGTNPTLYYLGGEAERVVDVNWNAGSYHFDSHVDLAIDNGERSVFARGRFGAKPVTIKVGSRHAFRLLASENKEVPPKIIAELTLIGDDGTPPLSGNGSGVESVNDSAAKGEALAQQDPLATELRDRHAEGPARRGFDIGMSVAEGHTLPGPGKDQICAALPPEEARGCSNAVLFSVDRNRNAKFATTGAAIAESDPTVADARIAEPDVMYRLGFDIATGIFGDPAKGAQGNTSTGPGSLGIRNSLNAAAQRGFDASVKLHLSRKY